MKTWRTDAARCSAAYTHPSFPLLSIFNRKNTATLSTIPLASAKITILYHTVRFSCFIYTLSTGPEKPFTSSHFELFYHPSVLKLQTLLTFACMSATFKSHKSKKGENADEILHRGHFNDRDLITN